VAKKIKFYDIDIRALPVGEVAETEKEIGKSKRQGETFVNWCYTKMSIMN